MGSTVPGALIVPPPLASRIGAPEPRDARAAVAHQTFVCQREPARALALHRGARVGGSRGHHGERSSAGIGHLGSAGRPGGGRRLPLFTQCAITAALFLFLAPGFGVQYLAWIVPWVAAAGALPAAVFHLTSGALLYSLYRTDYFGWPTAWGRSLLCWLAIGVVLATCLRHAVRGRRGRWTALALAIGVAVVLIGLPMTRALREGASGRPLVFASSTLDGYSAAAVLDGRGDSTRAAPAGGWYSARPPGPQAPETLVFAFPRATSISRIDLDAYPDPRFTLTSFVFQVAAADGWRDIDASRVADNSVATAWSFTVPPVEARLIRLRIDGAADAVARVIAVRFGDAAAAAPVSSP